MNASAIRTSGSCAKSTPSIPSCRSLASGACVASCATGQANELGRRRLRRLMCIMGMEAVGPKPRTSQPAPQNKVYPYLLRNREVRAPDEVWCADITYIPMPKGFAYLVAIMDWSSRAVLAWELSNTLDASFCVKAFCKAVTMAGRAPGIMNTDQGCQFTGEAWTGALQEHGVAVSMDGRGRWMDNV